MPKQTNTVQERINEIAAQYGNKAANLIELDRLCSAIKNTKIHINIPEIFPIDDHSIQQHLDKYAKEWRQLWEKFITLENNHKTLTNEGKNTLKTLRELITECFHKYPFSPQIIKKSKLSKNTLFMVRSSGDEDRVEIANPGGNKSVAAVKLDKSSISNAIGTVVASYFSEKSLTQRLLSGDDIHQAFMPVLIQKMIGEKLNGFNHPKQRVISGVMYAKQEGITRLDAAFGHGEIIVNSKAPFDTFEVTNDGIVHAAIHHKKSRLVATEIKDENNQVTRKLIFKENPKKLQNAPSVTPEVASEIASVGRRIANHYGMPMDIEWVFTPETQTLSIVQARPIPEGVKNKLSPSTISPDRWKKFKKDPDVQLSKTPVISPAGNVAKIVKSETTILSGNIASALNAYLKKSEHKHVDAVVVKEPAPSTSHEAAQFNLMGVPVYQGAIESIDRWLKEEKSVVIADTQHQYFVNLTNVNKQKKIDDEKTLRDEKTIVDGMYTSSLNASKTLLPGFIINKETIKGKVINYLSNNQGMNKVRDYAKSKKIYSNLVDCIETVESSKINDQNSDAFAALQTMADIFKAIGTSSKSHDKTEPHQQLFVHAMLSIAEIDHCLSDFSQLPAASDKQKEKQQELLDLISKLKALVINPSEPNLYSDSIHQLAVQAKTLQESKINVSKLNDIQQSYFVEFLKVKSLALNEKTQRIWAEFAYDCAQTPVSREMLSQMIMFAVDNNMLSELVNEHFVNTIKHRKINESVLVKLYALIDANRDEFKRYYIDENNQLLSAWENRINDWSNPKKFEKLLKEFYLELRPLISSLSLNDKMSNLTQQIILKQVERLTEVIDKSIKVMKSSMEYQGQEGLLVERFGKLLEPYYSLMENWLRALPDDFYAECAKKIRKAYLHNSKDRMLDAIFNGFKDKLRSKESKQLNASGHLNVASAKVGSNASFARQFVEQRAQLTLEDYFSLFHQNILASIAELNKKSMPSDADLPKIIQPLITEIKKADNVNLLHVIHRHPIIELEFNIPLDNHSAKFILEFNTKTKSLVINGKFFGMNWADRMILIGKIAEIEGLLAGEVLQQPVYHEDSRSLEFSWQINADRIPYLAKHIKEMVNHYAAMTESSIADLSDNYDKLWKRHCVDSSIPVEVLKCLSLENRRKLSEELLTINSGLLNATILKNPEFFPFFANKMIELINFADLSSLNLASFEKIINLYGLKLDLTIRAIGRETLLERLISAWPSEDSLKFLAKYQPDLTPHTSLFRHVKDNNPRLFEYLFTHGALFELEDLRDALNSPEIKQYAMNAMEKWETTQLSDWIFKNAYRAQYNFSSRPFILTIIDHLADKINFNYKSTNMMSLFELLVQLSYFESMTEHQFDEFLMKSKMDKQPATLRVLLLNVYRLGLVLLKKSIAGHVLDPDDLLYIRTRDIASLLAPWSAAELKSWVDNHSGKIAKSILHEIQSLYLAKSFHLLDLDFPETIQLDLKNVLITFNKNPELKSQVIDMFKLWNSDEMASWLSQSVRYLDLQSFPGLLEFIKSTHANINIDVLNHEQNSLFELIIPLLNEKMSKQEIEKFLNDHKFDINLNGKAFAKSVAANNDLLADILIDKGASFLRLDDSTLSQSFKNKNMYPVLLKAFMKLTKEERSKFLYSYNGDPDFYVQLIESLFKEQQEFQQWLAMNFQKVPQHLAEPVMKLYQSKFPDTDPIIPKNVNLDSLEDMLKYCFKNTVLSERIQHINIKNLIVEVNVEFTDSNEPLSNEQKDYIFNFFKQLGLKDWQIQSRDTWHSTYNSELGHGPQMELYLRGVDLTQLLKKHVITEQLNKFKSPLQQGSMFRSQNSSSVQDVQPAQQSGADIRSPQI